MKKSERFLATNIYHYYRTIAIKLSKFSLIGILVTVTSLLLSYYFLEIKKTSLYETYIAIYLSTITLSYILNSKYTFKVKFSCKKYLNYNLAYISGMVIGILCLTIYKSLLSFDNWILAYMVLPITFLWNFTIINNFIKDRTS